MKDLQIVVFAALMAAAAAPPLLAQPKLCANGLPPRLSGDMFVPVECSTATKTAPFLPSLPVLPVKGAKTDIRDLDGRWEGTLIHALGRYALLLTVKTGWTGKAEATLEMKELQFRERLTDRLSLRPGKKSGDYAAVMTVSSLPDASLEGQAVIGAAPTTVEVSTAAAKSSQPPTERQIDVTFSNGAAYRIIFSLKGKDEISVLTFSAIPGARLQKLETVLTRTKRESL